MSVSGNLDFAACREAMIKVQLQGRGIADERVLEAFRSVPREMFVSSNQTHLAYEDCPLPIEAQQTISQPYIVALMLVAAKIQPHDVVLEVGAGSGYAAALLGKLARKVIAIERKSELVERAQERIGRLGYDNVEIIQGDGTLGCSKWAPFDAILAAASGSHVPLKLIEQLKTGGRMVIPLGQTHAVQQLIKVTKDLAGTLIRENLGGVRFVPLIGKDA